MHVSGPPRASARSHTSMRYPAAMWRGIRPDGVGRGANGPVWMKKWVKSRFYPLSSRLVSRCGATERPRSLVYMYTGDDSLSSRVGVADLRVEGWT